jgi:hypothetical protein
MPDDRRTPPAGLPPAASRSAATNRPASRWNANSAGGRRCRDLFGSYMRALGSPTDEGTVALVIAAAEAVALAETARQDCLSGMTAINVELMIRLENTAARSLRRMGLNKAAPKPKGKSFREKLEDAERAARAESDASDGRSDA